MANEISLAKRANFCEELQKKGAWKIYLKINQIVRSFGNTTKFAGTKNETKTVKVSRAVALIKLRK